MKQIEKLETEQTNTFLREREKKKRFTEREIAARERRPVVGDRGGSWTAAESNSFLPLFLLLDLFCSYGFILICSLILRW
jgi:hypothetical protein